MTNDNPILKSKIPYNIQLVPKILDYDEEELREEFHEWLLIMDIFYFDGIARQHIGILQEDYDGIVLLFNPVGKYPEEKCNPGCMYAAIHAVIGRIEAVKGEVLQKSANNTFFSERNGF